MATLKKVIGIASAIAIPAAFVGIVTHITHKACEELETETETEVCSETELEDGCTARVSTEHKWWTRENEHLKLHSIKVGTIGTIRQKDLDEFKRLCEDNDFAKAEQKANAVVSMLISKGYKICSLYTYDSK